MEQIPSSEKILSKTEIDQQKSREAEVTKKINLFKEFLETKPDREECLSILSRAMNDLNIDRNFNESYNILKTYRKLFYDYLLKNIDEETLSFAFCMPSDPMSTNADAEFLNNINKFEDSQRNVYGFEDPDGFIDDRGFIDMAYMDKKYVEEMMDKLDGYVYFMNQSLFVENLRRCFAADCKSKRHIPAFVERAGKDGSLLYSYPSNILTEILPDDDSVREAENKVEKAKAMNKEEYIIFLNNKKNLEEQQVKEAIKNREIEKQKAEEVKNKKQKEEQERLSRQEELRKQL